MAKGAYAATFRERMERIMKRKGLTQGQIAVKSGLKRSTISMLFSGENGPSLNSAAALAEAFGVSLDYLTGLGEGKSVLSDNERELLSLYRAVPDDVKDLALGAMAVFAKQRD